MKIFILLQKLSARPKGTLIPEQARLPVAFHSEAGKELSTFGAASAKRSDGVARVEPNLFKLCRVTTEFEELKLLHLCRVVTKVMERSYITLNFLL